MVLILKHQDWLELGAGPRPRRAGLRFSQVGHGPIAVSAGLQVSQVPYPSRRFIAGSSAPGGETVICCCAQVCNRVHFDMLKQQVLFNVRIDISPLIKIE